MRKSFLRLPWSLYATSVVLGVSAIPGHAQDKPASSEQQQAPAASAQANAGLLPVPDYTGDFWTRQYLTGDWCGARTNLADKGVQFGLEWNQYAQGVAGGGIQRKSEYGGNFDYTIDLDLMRMGLWQGALVKFRAESRYGRSVNLASGTILPVNTDALFPVTGKLDQDVAITITDLNYTQFLSEHLGVFFGKFDTLDADLNEFASGRGTSEFMNANFIFNPVLALKLPYSTLGAGVVWMPIPPGTNGSITINNSVINTQDSSTTTGFQDFDNGTSWNPEVDFQYRLGRLPGGMNFGYLYSFNQTFATLNTRLVFQPGEGVVIPTSHTTWAAYWSGWQYLFTEQPGKLPVDLLNGEPDQQGVGIFTRVGFADKKTNPTRWAVSGGIGGRGMIPCRDNDTFGVGYYYNSVQTLRLLSALGLENSAHGLECFYNIAVTRACHVTLDMQIL